MCTLDHVDSIEKNVRSSSLYSGMCVLSNVACGLYSGLCVLYNRGVKSVVDYKGLYSEECVLCSGLCGLYNTVYPEILAVIKFGDLPEIWRKCIIGGI